jgi:hypothetical protein
LSDLLVEMILISAWSQLEISGEKALIPLCHEPTTTDTGIQGWRGKLGSGSWIEAARLGIRDYRRGGEVRDICSSMPIDSVTGVLIPYGASAAGLYPDTRPTAQSERSPLENKAHSLRVVIGHDIRVISLYIYEVNPGGFFMILVVVDA